MQAGFESTVKFREWICHTDAPTGLLLHLGHARLAGMVQVTISGFPTLKRVTQETASPTCSASASGLSGKVRFRT